MRSIVANRPGWPRFVHGSAESPRLPPRPMHRWRTPHRKEKHRADQGRGVDDDRRRHRAEPPRSTSHATTGDSTKARSHAMKRIRKICAKPPRTWRSGPSNSRPTSSVPTMSSADSHQRSRRRRALDVPRSAIPGRLRRLLAISWRSLHVAVQLGTARKRAPLPGEPSTGAKPNGGCAPRLPSGPIDGMNVGGTRTIVACSKSWANAISSASLNCPPMNETPIGKRRRRSRRRTVTLAQPVTLAEGVDEPMNGEPSLRSPPTGSSARPARSSAR